MAEGKKKEEEKGRAFNQTVGGACRPGAMWEGLGLVLALCLLPGGRAEVDIGGGGSRCKPAPPWSIGETEPMKEALGQASRMDYLHLKMEKQGLTNVTYMVVNHQGGPAQQLHQLLKEKLSENITLHQQLPGQVDVWQTLSGEKDDFLIYDRCGRLTYHIALPYSILSTPYVEQSIRDTYCKSLCGSCEYERPEQQVACNRTVEAEPEVRLNGEGPVVPPEVEGPHHGHGHRHTHDGHHGHHGTAERRGNGAGGQHQHVHHHAPEEQHHTHSQAQVHAAHDLAQQVMGGDLGQVHQEGAPEHPRQP
ncbi:hypothetical protein SKAU_G00015850 [Synaphobranchus kaupii]|uniref:Selenoprotein P N-terminal domain-containing protein n=1 Tax=Synaphobranchus kaupii TaxID=118154 RepID=A0A9Q1GCP5_SYNKA|nr:hypothetical protein SKAU_G00015850 [Synaphobranchus kaupii]